MRGFLIAGVRSGVGKTTISMGLMKCFENVSPFKVGPDYIDGKFHEYVTSNKSYNLDYILMGEEGIKYTFSKNSKGISIVEGVMGLFDGKESIFDNGSSAHISRILKLPVILVVDGQKISTSIAAEVLGYKNFDKRVNILGVIINKVSSEKTYNILREAIEKYCEIKCLGYINKIKSIEIEERHLGLFQVNEIESLDLKIKKISTEIKNKIDLDYIFNMSEIKIESNKSFMGKIKKNVGDKYKGMKIAVAKDSAFSFYYNDNLEFLENLGIELVYFSPIFDKEIPAGISMIYIGGGYPENYVNELSSNQRMKESIKIFYEKDGVIFGECGGFIYLSNTLKTLDGKIYKLVGISGCDIKMENKLDVKRFGYVDIEYKEDLFGKGHEFHYSKILKSKEGALKNFKVRKTKENNWVCGYKIKNVLCGYPHIHFFKSQDIIFDLLDLARRIK